MLSEWLEQIDNEDLEKNWIMCLCPIGKRCLVVASEGSTSVYNKGGKLIARHSSKLPGGSRDSKTGLFLFFSISFFFLISNYFKKMKLFLTAFIVKYCAHILY